MKIIITGAKGQLGNELISILQNKKSEIGRIDSRLDDVQVVGIDIDDLDISDSKCVLDFILRETPDVVINCAAMTNVNGCESNLELAFKVNALGPRNLAIACENVGAKLVHISTDYVFEGNSSKPYIEWDMCNPQNNYGKSKLMGEKYASQFCSKSFIVRTSWLYGYIGNNFVKTIIKLAREKDKIKVVNDQRGNPTNANDLAHHILKIILTEEFGVYHCTCNGECSWYDFACEFVALAGIKCDVETCSSDEFPSPTKRPAYSSLDNLMLRCTVGDEMRNWKDAIKQYIENAINRGII